ncbi:MFS transporter [Trujillonella endophytica]|uniref:Predicted arabinose efflux permease, MFS family n=1 Tax=Trujillonella endophytica TaxID=673521 RepID=A0A1H8V2X0_9ACTN|nr:MFS transporter [Trujillella endophytica]SEP09850.1 Predicted arabinose efflux permease, MFS family [Trujillella endophytica]
MSEGAVESRSPQGMFRSLRVRNYRLYASANLVSLIGTWMQRIGQDWLVLQLSDGSGVALGVVTALQFAPNLLLSMYGGVLADRYPKRRLLVITQALMGLLALALGILVTTGGVALWHVFVLAAGLGAVSAIDVPVRQVFVSEMVGPDLLTNAVGLNSTIFNGARLVGPAVAGLLIGASSGDTGPAFLVNAGSFAFTIAALFGMRSDELSSTPPVARARGQLRAGLAYTWSRPDLVLALTLAFLVGTFGLNTQVTIALMAREEFGLGAEAFGLLTTFFAVGSLTGALLSARRNARPRERFLVIAVVVLGVMCAVAGLMPGYVAFAAALVPMGAAAMMFTVANNTFVQLGADPQLRGRVMALYFMCLTGGMPIGAPVIGWVAEHLGAPWAFVLSGSLLVVAGLGAAAWLARSRRRAPRVGTADARSPITAA